MLPSLMIDAAPNVHPFNVTLILSEISTKRGNMHASDHRDFRQRWLDHVNEPSDSLTYIKYQCGASALVRTDRRIVGPCRAERSSQCPLQQCRSSFGLSASEGEYRRICR